jgi:signal transduction histidine kinase/DNA-binding response OmpR family regulator/CHASE3 domain sensor protein
MTPASGAVRLRRGDRLPPATVAGFVVALLALICIAVLSLRGLEARTQASDLLAQTLEAQQALQSLLSKVKDAETGQRGFLLTGDDQYLAPYDDAKATLGPAIAQLRGEIQNYAVERQQLDVLDRLIAAKMSELGQTVDLQRAGKTAEALAIVRSDRGEMAMKRIRDAVAQLQSEEQDELVQRRARWRRVVTSSVYFTWGSAALLLVLIAAAAATTLRSLRERGAQVWVRAGQTGLSTRMQGGQGLEQLAAHALDAIAGYLRADVGVLYVAEEGGGFRRVAGYAAASADGAPLREGEGLLGQAAKEKRALQVHDLPADYLPVNSALGRGAPRALAIVPAVVNDRTEAVIELGFCRRIEPVEMEFLGAVSESLGAAVRAAKDRSRLEELLEETQKQAEELQSQQEELRVSNEELEEQGRLLTDSQARLEEQQAELEQGNSQLEEHMRYLDERNSLLLSAQAALSEKAAELERTNRYKSEFLANMSHELRTPLNSTLILARMLADNKPGTLTAEQVRFAETIYGASNDLLALINDILDFSKIESGMVDLSWESVAIAPLVRSLAQEFEPLAERKGLRLSVAIEPTLPARMDSDPQRLGQILRNLLSNALKFTETGEISLQVSLSAQGGVAFAVHDTGIGIGDAQLQTIFEAFRQADGSTHRRYGGTGLGLSISRNLAQLLGGDIDVRSAPERGSTFTLTLPLFVDGGGVSRRERALAAQARMAATAAAGQPVEAALLPAATDAAAAPSSRVGDDRDRLDGDSRRVLIIEDDPRFAEILRDVAHEAGFQCLIAHTATEGLEAAARFGCSGVLLDVNLPDHSGLGVLDQLKRDPQTRHIPVYVLSVADYVREALERGAVGYALKPVQREQLLEALHLLGAKGVGGRRRVLVVEDNAAERLSIVELLSNGRTEVQGVASAREALQALLGESFDCVVADLKLPDANGFDFLEAMAAQQGGAWRPPTVVYTGRVLGRDEEQRLRRFARSIIIKDARSPERLLDEVTLFAHQREADLSPERRDMLKSVRARQTALDGRHVLLVEDDARNIFALSNLLEPAGMMVSIARNGREALSALRNEPGEGDRKVDLVLMDIMMPEMDGLTAMREIRKWADRKTLPIIALTAKAMKDDQERCLAAGANDYIAKPLDGQKLLSLIRVWIRP